MPSFKLRKELLEMSDVLLRILADTRAETARRKAQTPLAEMERKARGEQLPLYGVPCTVKDNIDVAGLDTSAACPAYAYQPARSAFVVERLIRDGAIVIAKTNLDQFATGLVGVRSPYGIPRNSFDAERVPGGSSSGSRSSSMGACLSPSANADDIGCGSWLA